MKQEDIVYSRAKDEFNRKLWVRWMKKKKILSYPVFEDFFLLWKQVESFFRERRVFSGNFQEKGKISSRLRTKVNFRIRWRLEKRFNHGAEYWNFYSNCPRHRKLSKSSRPSLTFPAWCKRPPGFGPFSAPTKPLIKQTKSEVRSSFRNVLEEISQLTHAHESEIPIYNPEAAPK